MGNENKVLSLEEKLKRVEDTWFDTHTKYDHFIRFEHDIRYIMAHVFTGESEYYFYAHMLLSLFMFNMSDEFTGSINNKTLLENNKNGFNSFLEEYEKRFKEDASYIRKFTNKYIFEGNSSNTKKYILVHRTDKSTVYHSVDFNGDPDFSENISDAVIFNNRESAQKYIDHANAKYEIEEVDVKLYA